MSLFFNAISNFSLRVHDFSSLYFSKVEEGYEIIYEKKLVQFKHWLLVKFSALKMQWNVILWYSFVLSSDRSIVIFFYYVHPNMMFAVPNPIASRSAHSGTFNQQTRTESIKRYVWFRQKCLNVHPKSFLLWTIAKKSYVPSPILWALNSICSLRYSNVSLSLYLERYSRFLKCLYLKIQTTTHQKSKFSIKKRSKIENISENEQNARQKIHSPHICITHHHGKPPWFRNLRYVSWLLLTRDDCCNLDYYLSKVLKIVRKNRAKSPTDTDIHWYYQFPITLLSMRLSHEKKTHEPKRIMEIMKLFEMKKKIIENTSNIR